MEISGNFDFMISLGQLSPKMGEMAKNARFLALFWFWDTTQHYYSTKEISF